MRNELRIQLEESTTLFGAKEQDIAKLRVAIPALRLEMRRLDQQFEQQYMDAQENWFSDVERAIEAALREIGELVQKSEVCTKIKSWLVFSKVFKRNVTLSTAKLSI